MNYYNEIDPTCRRWLRQLIRDGLIPDGYIDNRPIQEVRAREISEFNQCHFFAGIGGWALALAIAGVSPVRRIWTGSCPCQPFSIGNFAGPAEKGFNDKRHLWPVWLRLIKESQPAEIIGEQVASAIKFGWWDLVAGDLEKESYACGALVLPACGYGAFNERKRLYWIADSCREGWTGHQPDFGPSCRPNEAHPISRNALAHSGRVLEGDFSGLLPCDGLSVVMERFALKGYGNAIVPEVAAAFISAYGKIVT